MAVAQGNPLQADNNNEVQDQHQRFKPLFDNPSLEGMLALSWQDFQDFVKYVFECAGYIVDNVASKPKVHVDLHLYIGRKQGKPVAHVEVRRYQNAVISKARVLQFGGSVSNVGGSTGYMVTTNRFTKDAEEAARNDKKTNLVLLNKHRTLRYITYVGGSRLTGPNAPKYQPGVLIQPSVLDEADAIPRLDPKKTAVLALANNKGGVAKTTTSMNIGLVLAEKYDKRILLVDLDGQTSLSHLMPAQGPKPPALPPDDSRSISEHFATKVSLAELVRSTRFKNVWLIPAHPDLFKLDKGGAGQPKDELGFAKAIHDSSLVAPDGEPFDWIILDTPTAQTLYTRSALAAAHYVIIPFNPEFQAVLGAERALETVKTMQALTGGSPVIIGGLRTRWRESREAEKCESVMQDALGSNGSKFIDIVVRDDNRIDRANMRTGGGFLNDLFHLGINQGPAAQAYEKLVKEYLPHVNGR